MENKTPNFMEKVTGFFKSLSKKQLIAIIAAVVAIAVLIPVIILIPNGNNKPEETTPAETTPAATTPAETTPDNTPVAKDYKLVVVTDSAISSGKVSNHALALVIGADGKIVAARFDCAEITPELDEGGNLIAQASVATKVELGDDYNMGSGNWAEQTAAFEAALVGKTIEEAAAIDTTLVAGCTMPYTPFTFKALLTKAGTSELKVSFSTADPITVGLAIDSAVANSGSVTSDFAGIVIAGNKVVATMLDSCEQKFTVEDGELVAPETPAVSKNDQGENYGDGQSMAAGAWYKQAQAFANSTVDKTVAELADLETVSDALAAAGCTMQYTTAGYKATIIKAAGYAR